MATTTKEQEIETARGVHLKHLGEAIKAAQEAKRPDTVRVLRSMGFYVLAGMHPTSAHKAAVSEQSEQTIEEDAD